MQGNRFTVSVHLHGTLAANAQGRFIMPCQATLVEVSAVASNNSDATLAVGTSADEDGYSVAATIGDSGTPKVATLGGALVTSGTPVNVPNDTIIDWDLDFDGAGGTAAQNVTILFTFEE